MDTLEPIDPRLIEALGQPASYPDDPSASDGVEHIQTHLSHVFLTRDRVYKLRKAVSFDFVDFGSRGARLADCLDEVRLNRRLAPDVYLGVAEVTANPGGVQVGAAREPADWEGGAARSEVVTVMRRLPDARDALSLLRRGALSAVQVDGIARVIAGFHARCRLPASDPGAWPRLIARPVWAALGSLKGALAGCDEERLRSIDWRTREFESLHGYRFDRRLRDARRVEGHGDLHLQHVWFDGDGGPRIIDCLEFDRALREVDAACDVAFLTMDLRYRGRGHLAERFLAVYAEEADDYDLFGVLRYYESYRAVVRAKVAHLAAHDPAIDSGQRAAAVASRSQHLALAERLFREPRGGELVIMSGWVGTGKSSVARRLAGAIGAVRISSDVVRKKIAGVATQHSLQSGWNTGAYTPDRRRAVYEALQNRALEVLRSGRHVVLDASFATREERDNLSTWAREEGTRPFLVQTTCSDEEVTRRLEARRLAQTDASDAGPELLTASLEGYEAPDEWPEADRFRVDTEGPGWPGQVDELARGVEAARFG